MTFDPTITTADVLVVAGMVGSFLLFNIKLRDKTIAHDAALSSLKNDCDHRSQLSDQRIEFIERSVAEDRARNESHWTEVREAIGKLQTDFMSAIGRIMDKLEGKADKPNA